MPPFSLATSKTTSLFGVGWRWCPCQPFLFPTSVAQSIFRTSSSGRQMGLGSAPERQDYHRAAGRRISSVLRQRSQVTPRGKIPPSRYTSFCIFPIQTLPRSPWCLLKRATSSSKVWVRFISWRTCESSAAVSSLPSADAVATIREASSSQPVRSLSISSIGEDSSTTRGLCHFDQFA